MKKASIPEWGKKILAWLQSGDTEKPAAKRTTEKKEPYVYVTVKGKKFHYDILCPGLRNSNAVKMDLSKARKAGYTACDKCCYNYLRD